ncbi:MAG: hypothetical protein AAF203_06260 [Pseudomonadota bacterium]
MLFLRSLWKRVQVGLFFSLFLLQTTCVSTSSKGPQVSASSLEIEVLEQSIPETSSGVNELFSHVKKVIKTRIIKNLGKNTDHLDRYMTCAPLSNPAAFICVSFYQEDLNKTLTRMGLFMGAGKCLKKGTLVANHDPTLRNFQKLVAGHNLPGEVIRDFYQVVSQDSNKTLNPHEEAFFNSFIKKLPKEQKKFYVIGLSIQSMKPQLAVASHEIFHTHYYLNPNFKKTVDLFWQKKVSGKDKAGIKAILGKAYNLDDFILIDEFQAYLLQDKAESDSLKAFSPQYSQKLRRALKKAKISLPSWNQ